MEPLPVIAMGERVKTGSTYSPCVESATTTL